MVERKRFVRLLVIYAAIAAAIMGLIVLENSGPSPVGALEEAVVGDEPIGKVTGNGAMVVKHCDDGAEHDRCADAPMSGSINGDCPAGTTLVAKFEFRGNTYVFEGPAGNEGIITITGTATGGTWSSTVLIDAVVLKGANDLKVIGYDGGAVSGSFDNSGMTSDGGQTPDISNIRFCT